MVMANGCVLSSPALLMILSYIFFLTRVNYVNKISENEQGDVISFFSGANDEYQDNFKLQLQDVPIELVRHFESVHRYKRKRKFRRAYFYYYKNTDAVFHLEYL